MVPYPIESALSGIQRHEDHMVYRRTFEVPSGWGVGSGQRVLLNFGAVDYDATVFVNGSEVARHIGGYESFGADVTDALTTGPNELVVRVMDTTGGFPKGKQSANPSGIFYTPSSGIWQTVWPEPVAPAHIDKLTLTPDVPSSTLAATVAAPAASPSARVTVTAFDAEGAEVGQATGAPGEKLSVPIPDARLWSPDDPYLYDLTATVADGGTTDTVRSYARMRSIGLDTVGGSQRIVLNGQQTFLLSTLDQGYWPDGVYTAPTDAALKWDIQQTKDLGFNTIRKHIKVEPARWYYYADLLGMIVWQDMPSGGNADDDARDGFRTELTGMVDQLDSVTSIIGWVPFNEGWGEWDRTATGRIADAVKAQDPSRLVNAHSGVNCCNSKGDSGRGDVIDWHQYTGPALPHPDATRAAIDGEHGGFSYSDPAHTWPGGSVNPYGEVDSPAELTAVYVKNTAALIAPAQQDLSGSIYTQITDVEGEVNGFWTYDRRVLKMDAAQVRAINRKVIEVGSQPRTLPEPTGGTDGVAYWPLNASSGTEAADATGNGHTLAAGSPDWQQGRLGSALGFGAAEQTATASVPEIDTTASYTVSAWVRMDALPSAGTYATVASMDGLTGRSAFFLQYGDPVKGFAFSFPDGPPAVAAVTPTLGSWHHLTGVRDAVSGELTLYLDGERAATQRSAGGTASTGEFQLGRGQWDGKPVDLLTGAVDEVHLYDRALSAAEVAALAAPPAPTVVVPPAVAFTDAPGTADDSYTIPAATGVEYLVSIDGGPSAVVAAGTYPAAGSVTVTARALDGHRIPDDADVSWTYLFSADAAITVPDGSGVPDGSDDSDGCGSPSTPVTASSPDGLAATGSEIGGIALAAMILLAAGLLVLARRRAVAAHPRR